MKVEDGKNKVLFYAMPASPLKDVCISYLLWILSDSMVGFSAWKNSKDASGLKTYDLT